MYGEAEPTVVFCASVIWGRQPSVQRLRAGDIPGSRGRPLSANRGRVHSSSRSCSSSSSVVACLDWEMSYSTEETRAAVRDPSAVRGDLICRPLTSTTTRTLTGRRRPRMGFHPRRRPWRQGARCALAAACSVTRAPTSALFANVSGPAMRGNLMFNFLFFRTFHIPDSTQGYTKKIGFSTDCIVLRRSSAAHQEY